MSVTFHASRFDEARGHDVPLFTCDCTDWCAECQQREINLSNVNARDLLDWLALSTSDDLYGTVLASDLAARCRRRLWDEPRNQDPGVEPVVDQTPGRATLIDCGRPPGYLRERARQLLHIAELAGEHEVSWG